MRPTFDTAVELREAAAPPLRTFDLVAYAKKHRYRTRNLHDGNPLPPAIHKGAIDKTRGWWGAEDRWDAIVGHRGYVAIDGTSLTVCVFCKSTRGVNQAVARLQEIGARVDQIGDTEVGASVSPPQIEPVLDLIKVSKLRPPNEGSFSPGSEHAPGPRMAWMADENA